jgi:hypothetical protein
MLPFLCGILLGSVIHSQGGEDQTAKGLHGSQCGFSAGTAG